VGGTLVRTSFGIAFAATVCCTATAFAADWTNIRIATEGAYPPWNSTDSSGQLIGFEIDLAAEVCERMGAQCEIVAQDWDGIIPALTGGKYDAIMAGMSITDERKEVISFSSCYANEPAKFAMLKDSPLAGLTAAVDSINLDTIEPEEQAAIDALKEALEGTTIGVQVATIHQNFLDQHLGDVVEVRSYDTQENLDLDLEAGRVDAALASVSYWGPLLETEKGANLTLVGPGMNGGPFGAGVGVGIRQDDTDLVEKFNAAIEEVSADGTLDKLSEQWFGFTLPCG
jgi:octopine/nopaline transport system substrate-binding protein